MKTFGFGVIGCGARSNSFIRAMKEDPQHRGDIVALCDIRDDAMDVYESHVNTIMGHKCKRYHDYQALLRDPAVDVVVVSTPDYLHYMHALDAFHAGKHVFCEKPIGVTFDQMIDLLKAAKESGKIMECGYELRYSPFFVKIKELLDNGDIGRPMFVQALEEYYGAYHFNRGWWRKKCNTGGIMTQKICHDMDLFTWMFGKPVRVSAFDKINEFKPGNWESDAKYCKDCKNKCPYFVTEKSRTYSDECVYNSDHDVADCAQVILEFESGLILSMGMNFFNAHAQDDRHWKVVGSKAEISGRLATQTLQYDPRFDTSKTKSILIECTEGGREGHGGGDERQWIGFLEALSENREAKSGRLAAYWSMITVLSAQLSADTGETVYIDEIIAQYPFPG
jgi:predicted dehydrogenase